MPLELIIGPASAGVTRAIHSRTVESVRRGGRALLLVPSAPDVSRVTRELAAEVALGLDVRAFDHHLDALWAARGDGRTPVTPAQRLVLLEKSGSLTDDRALAPQCPTPGLVRTMVRVVQRAAEAPRTTLDVAGERVSDRLLEWLARYQALLRSAGLVERAEAHRIAAEPSGPQTAETMVAVEGFSGFTIAQERYLVGRAPGAAVVIGVTFDSSVPATSAAEGVVSRLGRVGPVIALHPPDNAATSPELVRVASAFGRASADTSVQTGAVRLSDAWGEDSEAARITREIQDAMADGIPADEIAVVFRDARHVPAMRSALEEAGILAEYDMRVPFTSSGLGRALLLLLAVSGPAGTYDQLLDLLRSQYGPGDETAMDELDSHVRRGRTCDVPSAEAWLRRNDHGSARLLRHARSARREPGTAASERAWYGLVSTMMRRAHGGRADAGLDLALDAAAARMFMEAVRGLSALGAHAASDGALPAALREASIALVAAGRTDHIKVLSAERARGRHYRCVIVGGLVAGEFPRSAGEDALSAPAVARAFASAGIDVMPRADLAAERLIFYLAVTRATERLVLSWQSHDSSGAARRRSIFVDEMLDLYRDPLSGAYRSGEPPCQRMGFDAAGLDPAGPRTQRRMLRAAASEPRVYDTPELSEARRRAQRRTDTASDAARRLAQEREVFSASEIEAYLHCPHRWFVASVVAPRELDDRFDAASVGQVAHEILRQFYDVLTGETGLARVTPDSLDLARALHARVAATTTGRISGIAASQAAAVRTVARRTLALIEADAELLPGFAPGYREWSFGASEDDPPEQLGTFALRGRVDRIDVNSSDLVVTDYKLGAVGADRGVQKFAAQGLVQLPLYAEIASRRLGLGVAGGLYRSVKGGKPRGFIVDTLADAQFVRTDLVSAGDVRAALDSALDRAAQAVERMRAGDIRPEPLGGECPPYCPARAFCTDRRESRG